MWQTGHINKNSGTRPPVTDSLEHSLTLTQLGCWQETKLFKMASSAQVPQKARVMTGVSVHIHIQVKIRVGVNISISVEACQAYGVGGVNPPLFNLTLIRAPVHCYVWGTERGGRIPACWE